MRLTFLDLGQDGDDADADTQDQVEGDEELVQLAFRRLKQPSINEDKIKKYYNKGVKNNNNKKPVII